MNIISDKLITKLILYPNNPERGIEIITELPKIDIISEGNMGKEITLNINCKGINN